MICKINGVDFKDFVVAGTYDVNRELAYSEWEDSNHRTHRSDIRRCVRGAFNLYFKDMSDYERWVMCAYDSMLEDGTFEVEVSVNNSFDTYEGRAYIYYAPVRSRTADTLEDYFEEFSVTIAEVIQ